MKRFPLALFLILMASLILSGCDAFRRIAGRPTSFQIEEKRKLIERLEAARQHRLDSLMEVEMRMMDSLAALDSIGVVDSLETDGVVSASETEPVSESVGQTPARNLVSEKKNREKSPFCIVIGTFGSHQNALNLASIAESNGFPATFLKGRNGSTIVTICPSETEEQALEYLEKLRGKSFCPKDAWILNRR